MEEWLVKLRTAVQAAAPGSGLYMIGKAEAVSRMDLEDWRETPSHLRSDLPERNPEYTRAEKNAEEEIGPAIKLKLPVAAQRHAQTIAQAKGEPMELHVAMSNAFLMIMSTTESEAEGVVDALKTKRAFLQNRFLDT